MIHISKSYYTLTWSDSFNLKLRKMKLPNRERTKEYKKVRQDLKERKLKFDVKYKTKAPAEKLLAKLEKIYPDTFVITEQSDIYF